MVMYLNKGFVSAILLFCFLSVTTPSIAQQLTDKIVAIVNDDVITAIELNQRIAMLKAENRLPSFDVNVRRHQEILEGLVEERVQLQRAAQLGITVTDAEVLRLAEQTLKPRNITLEQFSKDLQKSGSNVDVFLDGLRTRLIIRQLVRRDTVRSISVTQDELDNYIKANNIQAKPKSYDLSFLLVTAPESEEKSQELIDAVQKAKVESTDASLATLIKTLSKQGIKAQQKDVGVLSDDKLPDLFVDTLQKMNEGELSDVLNAAAGLYILKLKRVIGLADVPERRKAQHILISANSDLKVDQARKQLLRLKEQIIAGEDFSLLAKYYSDDPGSAAKGGDLGWVRKGEMVPPFERALFKLKIDQLSDVVVSDFGVHLIKLNDISRSSDPLEETRSIAYNALMSQKVDQYYPAWLSKLIGRAYIQYL